MKDFTTVQSAKNKIISMTLTILRSVDGMQQRGDDKTQILASGHLTYHA